MTLTLDEARALPDWCPTCDSPHRGECRRRRVTERPAPTVDRRPDDPVCVGMRERDFQACVIAKATRNGWMHYHTHDSRRSVAGFPDLVLVNAMHRLVVFGEIKRDRRKPTPDQIEWLDTLSNAGALACLWRPDDYGEIRKALAHPDDMHGLDWPGEWHVRREEYGL